MLSDAMDCPNGAEHTPCPRGYVEWHDWAARMGKTHRQRRCAGCSRLTIWQPIGGASVE